MSFNKWWPDLKKHSKRVNYLLPHAKLLKANLHSARPFRYFTLCAPSMIDVFLLAKAEVLSYDALRRAIDKVVFCEIDKEHVPMMRELIGREDSGFQGDLEDLVLFDDNDLTATLPDVRAIESYIIQKGESLGDQLELLQKKIGHLEMQRTFPFDFINLDFCDHYYPDPGMMKINRTIERMLEWQRRVQVDANLRVDQFMMAVTCRHDTNLSAASQQRLLNVIRSNCEEFPDYNAEVISSRGVEIESWAESSNLDFFLAGWPKEIAHLADQKQWNMEIAEYIHYSRIGSSGQPYEMVCLVCSFNRTDFSTTYLDVSLKALDQQNRVRINPINREDENGKTLLNDLASVVAMRNLHAQHANRETLPSPADAIRYFESQGVQY